MRLYTIRFQVAMTPSRFIYSGILFSRCLNSNLSDSSIPTYLRIFFFMLSGGSVVHLSEAYNTDCGNVLTGVDDRKRRKSGFNGSVI